MWRSWKLKLLLSSELQLLLVLRIEALRDLWFFGGSSCINYCGSDAVAVARSWLMLLDAERRRWRWGN